MKNLTEKILDLERISLELEPSIAERDAYNKQMQDYANNFIDSTETNPSYYKGTPDANQLGISTNKKELKDLLAIYHSEVVQQGINPASGGHLGYIPGGGI